ncbi:hemagglutination activity domain protein [Leptolyngbya boryana NIES-2135]|jgi:filamentous hemagglutinin family protein|uniref:Hemagglutination activity domain protein n=1 Tax=Leptolyngbya boryana NIES-2135 TaxID=1973484 RepID=A0A1Z4JNJ7_LEPBY|nr:MULTISPECIES: S-layer family protein [Leptolyngbya]BAY58270.1 hemagglutination activity domain protein [Leptolyngbya boryana NIES-2135]MBD2367945.1 S-layer family protein [Leptolyngbya sp. FACHB-161]MBD2374469.1 S-layer family protein [Leptolyngbya sp. FACHB-238]MBD2398891.1 S-layer family protein [Leptolyngbya sp. FACHB-239]MBD2405292.1 S-layer family protein [Leptolyngbya sp. FACHB-402]
MKKILGFPVSFCSFLPLLSGSQTLLAQIVPDATLSQPSIVNNNTIQGGTRSGTALFHSFKEFSIPTDSQAQFLPDAQVQNIILRVTGNQRSLIDGTLSVNGTANLFFLNPNGITFGQNARLAINGSLIASTADSWTFSNGSEYSARNPQAPPLLTISTPIGLQFGARPGNIVHQANLSLPPGKILGFAGGEIRLDNASLNSPSGTIFLVSAMQSGTLQLLTTGLGETNIEQFGNIELSGASAIDASGLGGGAVQIRGNQVTLRDQATIFSDTIGAIDGRDIEIQSNQFSLQDRAFVRAFTVGSGSGGNLSIRAKDAIALTGMGYPAFEQNLLGNYLFGNLDPRTVESAILTGTAGSARGGNLTISTPQLSLKEGSAIVDLTQASGAGGNLSVRGADTIEVISSSLGTLASGDGKSGDVQIQTRRLNVSNTGIITSGTIGSGNSGNLTITADTVKVSGAFPQGVVASNIVTSTLAGTGNAGNLTINARQIHIENGASIVSESGVNLGGSVLVSSGKGGNVILNASDEIRLSGVGLPQSPNSSISTLTFGTAQAGDIYINTRRLLIFDQSLIEASSLTFGKGGNITINASESIQIVGNLNRVIGINTNAEGGEPFTNTNSAGNIRLRTSKLSLSNLGQISVSSFGKGATGSIDVQADTIELNNSRISATTRAGSKGNIGIQAQNIVLRNGSKIQTDAGDSDGGNIDLQTKILLAIPLENSDITADAQAGRGGNINIKTQGIFGFQLGSASDFSDVNASSGLGLDGTVKLTTFAQEPTIRSNLPNGMVDRSTQIAPTCAKVATTSQFVVTQRSGLEPNVNEAVQSTPVWIDVRGERSHKILQESAPEITEASGWVKRADGEIMLVSESANRPILNPCLIPARADSAP